MDRDEILLRAVPQAAGKVYEEERTKRQAAELTTEQLLEDYLECGNAYGPAIEILNKKNRPEAAQRSTLIEDLAERGKNMAEQVGEKRLRGMIRNRLEGLVDAYGRLACAEVPKTRVCCGRSVEGYSKKLADPYHEEAALLMILSGSLDIEEHMIMRGDMFRNDPLGFLSETEQKYGL